MLQVEFPILGAIPIKQGQNGHTIKIWAYGMLTK